MKINKRPFLLLEVLIAIALVSLCILPLLSPYVAIFKDQRHFADKIELDHAINLLYGDIIEKLHRNSIPWEAIEGSQSFSVDSEALKELTGYPVPWRGSYFFDFKESKFKPKPAEPFTVYLLTLVFSFQPLIAPEKETEPLKYSYQVFVARQLPGGKGEAPPPEKKNDGKSDGKKPPAKPPSGK